MSVVRCCLQAVAGSCIAPTAAAAETVGWLDLQWVNTIPQNAWFHKSDYDTAVSEWDQHPTTWSAEVGILAAHTGMLASAGSDLPVFVANAHLQQNKSGLYTLQHQVHGGPKAIDV